MKSVLLIIEVIVAILLVGSILLQAKGTGLGSSFGGSGELYQSKRGVEKIVFYGTIVFASLFAVLSILLLVLP